MAQEHDLSEFKQLASPTGGRCTVSKILAHLEGDEREKLLAALAAPDIQSVAISRWLKQRDLPIGDQSIARHRRGVCACA